VTNFSRSCGHGQLELDTNVPSKFHQNSFQTESTACTAVTNRQTTDTQRLTNTEVTT